MSDEIPAEEVNVPAEPAVAASYIGSDKVSIVAESDQKTPMGSDIVEVTFENGTKATMPKKTYELTVTDVPSDASIVRRTKFNQLVPGIKALICEYDITVAEIQPLLQELAAGIDNNFARATNFAWTGDDSQFIPNTNPLYNRSLLEADALIRSIDAEKTPENGEIPA